MLQCKGINKISEFKSGLTLIGAQTNEYGSRQLSQNGYKTRNVFSFCPGDCPEIGENKII